MDLCGAGPIGPMPMHRDALGTNPWPNARPSGGKRELWCLFDLVMGNESKEICFRRHSAYSCPLWGFLSRTGLTFPARMDLELCSIHLGHGHTVPRDVRSGGRRLRQPSPADACGFGTGSIRREPCPNTCFSEIGLFAVLPSQPDGERDREQGKRILTLGGLINRHSRESGNPCRLLPGS